MLFLHRLLFSQCRGLNSHRVGVTSCLVAPISVKKIMDIKYFDSGEGGFFFKVFS